MDVILSSIIPIRQWKVVSKSFPGAILLFLQADCWPEGQAEISPGQAWGANQLLHTRVSARQGERE
jgi:hypothetical protein